MDKTGRAPKEMCEKEREGEETNPKSWIPVTSRPSTNSLKLAAKICYSEYGDWREPAGGGFCS